MKQGIKIVEEKRNVFVANDGTEFYRKIDCLWYENKDTFSSKFPTRKLYDGNEEKYYELYFLESKEDYEVLKSYYVSKLRYSWNDNNGIDKGKFPTHILIDTIDCDNPWVDVYTKKYFIELMKETSKNALNFVEDLNYYTINS
jgi:hypothetical protein